MLRDLTLLMVLSSTALMMHRLYPDSVGELLIGLTGFGYFFVYLPWRWWSGR